MLYVSKAGCGLKNLFGIKRIHILGNGQIDFAILGNIFVGKAVDEAASWHEQADWIGVHLTPSAEYAFKSTAKKSAWAPLAALYEPVVLEERALRPLAVLDEPLVLRLRAW